MIERVFRVVLDRCGAQVELAAGLAVAGAEASSVARDYEAPAHACVPCIKYQRMETNADEALRAGIVQKGICIGPRDHL